MYKFRFFWIYFLHSDIHNSLFPFRIRIYLIKINFNAVVACTFVPTWKILWIYDMNVWKLSFWLLSRNCADFNKKINEF